MHEGKGAGIPLFSNADLTKVRLITSFPDIARNNPVFAYGTQYLCHLKKEARAPKRRVRMNTMAASTTFVLFIPPATETATSFARIATGPQISQQRRRRITPQAGRALEILGHAIEYLTDEFVHEGGTLSAENDRLKAVQLLMALNRQIYFECPEAPTFAERCRSILHLHAA